MPCFTLTSDDEADAPHTLIADNTGQLLGLIHRLGWRSAYIDQDGRYLFSLFYDCHGVWTLSSRRRQKPRFRLVS